MQIIRIFFFQISQLVISFATYKVINSYYNITDFGLYVAFLTIYTLASQLILIGLETYYVKYCGFKSNDAIKIKMREFKFRIILIFPIVIAMAYFISSYITSLPKYILLIGCTGVIGSYQGFLVSAFRGRQMLLKLRSFLLFENLFSLILIVCLSFLDFGIDKLIFGLVFAKILVLILMEHSFVRSLLTIRTPAPNITQNVENEKLPYLKLGIFNILINNFAKVYFVFISVEALALLSAINSFVIKFRDIFKNSLEWYTIKLVVLKEAEAANLVKNLIFYGLSSSIVVIILVNFTISIVVDFIFGKDFLIIIDWIMIGVLTLPILVANFILKQYDQFKRDGKIARKFEYLRHIMLLFLIFLLLDRYSYGAPILAMLISEIVSFIFIVVMISKRSYRLN